MLVSHRAARRHRIQHARQHRRTVLRVIGSIFYGNVLGIFLLAFFIRYVKGKAVFVAALITQLIVIAIWYLDLMPYLWLNVVGCALVMGIALILQAVMGKGEQA